MNLQKLINSYKQEWKKNGMGSGISFSRLISELEKIQEQLDTPVVTPSCSKEKLIDGLKEALISYQKNIGKYESEFQFIQDEDFEEIAQDLIEFCRLF